MGSDKALLSLGNENCLQRALRIVAAVCPKPVIVGDPARYASFGEVVADRMAGCGPLGGIQSALYVSRSDRNLILSVDMPLMTPEFLLWLVERSVDGAAMVTVPRAGGRPQPLCAVYRRELLPDIEKAIVSGEYKVDRMFAHLPVRYLPDSEICAAGFDEDIFANVNTPEDFELLKRHFAEGVPSGGPQARR
jgi:molybdenum cofactor guanylyltransferase